MKLPQRYLYSFISPVVISFLAGIERTKNVHTYAWSRRSKRFTGDWMITKPLGLAQRQGSRWHIPYNEFNYTFTNSQSLYDSFEQTFRESPSS